MFLIKRRIPIVIIIILMLSLLSLSYALSASSRAPPAPKELTATPRDTNIRLSWNEPDSGVLTVINYYLYRSAPDEDTIRLLIDPDTTTFSDRAVENGKEYGYYVTALYNVGESGPSNYVYVTPDGDPPHLTINSPLEGSIFGPGIVSVSWTGTDKTSEIDRFEIRIDLMNWIDVGLKSDHQFSDLTSGDHYIQVRATDLGLNRAYDSVNITIDDKAPIVVIRTPSDHEFITKKNLTITWDTYESESRIASYEVHLNGHYTGYKGNKTSYTIDSIKDGDYRIDVLAYDIVGNLGMDSINVSIDTSGPSIHIFEPPTGFITNSTEVYFLWETFDHSEKVKNMIHHEDIGWIDIGYETEFTFGPLKQGYHKIGLKAIDSAGWETEVERTFLVDITPPDIDIIYPDDEHIQSENKITLIWEAYNSLSGIEDIWVSLDGRKWILTRVMQFDITDLTTGDHTASIKTIDKAGNVVINSVSFFIDDVEPQIIDYGPIGSNIDLPNEIWIEFTEEMGSVIISVEGITGKIRINDNRYVWGPDGPFVFGNNYLVKVVGEDLRGNILEYFAWTFTVTDQVLVVGAVYDLDGDPIGSSKIIMDSGRITLTEKDGKFNLTAQMGDRTFLITKEGYKTEEISLNLTPGRIGYIGNVYLIKESSDAGWKVPSFIFDPWSYFVVFLILVAIGLIVYLFKDQINFTLEKIKQIRRSWPERREK